MKRIVKNRNLARIRSLLSPFILFHTKSEPLHTGCTSSLTESQLDTPLSALLSHTLDQQALLYNRNGPTFSPTSHTSPIWTQRTTNNNLPTFCNIFSAIIHWCNLDSLTHCAMRAAIMVKLTRSECMTQWRLTIGWHNDNNSFNPVL